MGRELPQSPQQLARTGRHPSSHGTSTAGAGAVQRTASAVPCRAAPRCTILLRYTAPHRTVLCYTVLSYTTLHYTGLCYTTLHCAILHYTALRYTTLYYTTLHYTALLYRTALYSTTLCYTTLRYATLCRAAPHTPAVPGHTAPDGGAPPRPALLRCAHCAAHRSRAELPRR